MLTRLAVIILGIFLSHGPSVAQDGSGAVAERTKASAHEFFTKMAGQNAYRVEARFTSSCATFNIDPTISCATVDPYESTPPGRFFPGWIRAIAPSPSDDCTSVVTAVFAKNDKWGGYGYVPETYGTNPMALIFNQSGGPEATGSAVMDWKTATVVSHQGAKVIVKWPSFELRFTFGDSTVAGRFAQAMEFMRTTCDASADLAF